jgi:predicted nucleic acid-binding protein
VSVVVDANVAVAVLDAADPFHKVALDRCLREKKIHVLNVTWAEALVLPAKLKRFEEAGAVLVGVGFCVEVVSDEVADLACHLRAKYGNKNFPLLDALVVALGVHSGSSVVTCDAKWPQISEAKIELLSPLPSI